MIKISEFSKLTGVPVKTIRYYEELGLIKPAEIDAWTGYRRFDEKNAEQLLRIIYLKKLGFTLAEIKNFDENSLKEKALEIKKKISQFKKNLKDISNLYKNEKGEYIMKNFVNDENLIGKWKLLGVAESEEDLKENKIELNSDFGLNKLIFLPKGESYWVITFWTKGNIFIKNVPMKYEIKDNKLIIAFDWDVSGEVEYYAVYENVDHKAYKYEEVVKTDDINIPFENDEDLKGIWVVDNFVKNIEDFKENTSKDIDYMYKNLAIFDNGEVVVTYSDNKSNANILTWTKGYIINKSAKVAQEYCIKNINGHDYLFMQHKSGDYTFGGHIPYYYVFKKQK